MGTLSGSIGLYLCCVSRCDVGATTRTELGVMNVQTMKWMSRLLTWGVLVTILSFEISPPSFACQLYDGSSGPTNLLEQIGSTQKRLEGIWVGVVVVSGIK